MANVAIPRKTSPPISARDERFRKVPAACNRITRTRSPAAVKATPPRDCVSRSALPITIQIPIRMKTGSVRFSTEFRNRRELSNAPDASLFRYRIAIAKDAIRPTPANTA